MHLTGQILQATYDLLRTLPPFHHWRLPHSSSLIFRVNRSTMTLGTFDVDPPIISLSSVMNKTMQDVLETMAHEMTHLHLERNGKGGHEDHNEGFTNARDEVCLAWGWNKDKF